MRKIIILLLLVVLISCEKQSTKPAEPNYTNFKILSIKISSLPFKDANSGDWDPFDGPDICYTIEDLAGNVLYNGSDQRFKDIANSDLPLIWDFTTAYTITNINVTHFITIYDYDTFDANDLVGYIGFTMNDHKKGYPKTIEKKAGSLTISIVGEWY